MTRSSRKDFSRKLGFTQDSTTTSYFSSSLTHSASRGAQTDTGTSVSPAARQGGRLQKQAGVQPCKVTASLPDKVPVAREGLLSFERTKLNSVK